MDAALAGELGVLVLIDTAGCGMEEEEEEEGGESRANPGEARAALAHVRRLLAAGVRAADVGVITPYNAQVRATARPWNLQCAKNVVCFIAGSWSHAVNLFDGTCRANMVRVARLLTLCPHRC